MELNKGQKVCSLVKKKKCDWIFFKCENECLILDSQLWKMKDTALKINISWSIFFPNFKKHLESHAELFKNKKSFSVSQINLLEFYYSIFQVEGFKITVLFFFPLSIPVFRFGMIQIFSLLSVHIFFGSNIWRCSGVGARLRLKGLVDCEWRQCKDGPWLCSFKDKAQHSVCTVSAR